MKRKLVFFAVILCVIFAGFAVYHFRERFSQTVEAAEKGWRESNHTPESWQSVRAESDDMFSALIYADDQTDFYYFVYIKGEKDLEFPFRRGGSNGDIQEHIACYASPELADEVFLSMNLKNVCSITIDDGNEIMTEEVDPNTPFVYIIPKGYEVIFRDAEGNRIEPGRFTLLFGSKRITQSVNRGHKSGRRSPDRRGCSPVKKPSL